MSKKISSRYARLLILIFLITIPYSCNKPEEERWICILNCDPEDCLFLDEETCECVEDIECQYENLLDCGGNGEPACECMEQDGGDWCTALTNDSIKVWELASYIDHFIGDTIFMEGPSKILQTYRIDHLFVGDGVSGEWAVYSWEFNDIHQPTQINYTFMNYPKDLHLTNTEIDLVTLNEDTLRLAFHDDWIYGNTDYIYVPRE